MLKVISITPNVFIEIVVFPDEIDIICFPPEMAPSCENDQINNSINLKCIKPIPSEKLLLIFRWIFYHMITLSSTFPAYRIQMEKINIWLAFLQGTCATHADEYRDILFFELFVSLSGLIYDIS